MHKMLLNSLELGFEIRPRGPILIKSGVEAGVDPTLPNMNFVRGMHPLHGKQTIYLPGSSLKGVLRSHAERIVRTVGVPCCDPVGDDACDRKSEFQNRQRTLSGAETYNLLCAACKIFGHTVMASRLLMPDAYPKKAIDQLPTRQMVAIDRRSGGSANTFTMEVATSGVFQAKLVLNNFERWQVGLLALALRDVLSGKVGIGFGKSRGLGQVFLDFTYLKLNYPLQLRQDAVQRFVHGVGEVRDMLPTQDDGLAAYQFAQSSFARQEPHIPANPKVDTDWGRFEVTVEGHTDVEAVLKAQVPAWVTFQERH